MQSLRSHTQSSSQQLAGCTASAARLQLSVKLPCLPKAQRTNLCWVSSWPVQQQQRQRQCCQYAGHFQHQLQQHVLLSRQGSLSNKRHAASSVSNSNNAPVSSQPGQQQHQQQQPTEQENSSTNSSSNGSSSSGKSNKSIPIRISATTDQETCSLEDTKTLVETAMLSAVSGLAFLLSTLLKLDNSLGYFLPLPIAIAACRSGVGAAWHTMMATAFLLLVLLGPLRATTYVLMHGMLAAALGSMWVWSWPWSASILAGAVLRMLGQLGYLVLSSVTMNENLFAVMLANVHNLLDRLSAALGSSGSPSTLTISCMIFALLLVNGICYVFLLHVVYHVILSSMGFKMGPLPGIVKKYLYAGAPPAAQAATEKSGA